MDSNEITAVLRNEPASHAVFRGVYAQNELRQAISKCERMGAPGAFVINTDPATQPGEHWLAIFYNDALEFEFFDTYDAPPSVYGFVGPWNFTNTNTRKVQSLTSDACGQHCIFYIHERCLHPTVKDPYVQFPRGTPVEEIDAAVKRYVVKLQNDESQSGNGAARMTYAGGFRQISNTYAHYRKLMDTRAYKPEHDARK